MALRKKRNEFSQAILPNQFWKIIVSVTAIRVIPFKINLS